MTHPRFVFAAAAIVAWAPPAYPQAVPGQRLIVINNTSRGHMCAAKLPGQGWSGWFRIDPGANWMLEQAPNSGVKFQCAPPVRQRTYPLKRGKKYNLLRGDDGAVALIELTVATPTPPAN